MAHEEQILSSSNSGSESGFVTGRSRKSRQKKVPQRGLGVAQLEKIIVEEQRREALQSSTNNHHHLFRDPAPSFNLQCPNFSPLYGSPSSVPVQIMNHEIGLKSDSGGSKRRFSCQFQGHSFSSSTSSNCSSVVNAPPSVFCSQIEPPSNQIRHGNNNYTFQHKMVGMKRSFTYAHEPPQAEQETAYASDGAATGDNGDFLTLAPPGVQPYSKHQQKKKSEPFDLLPRFKSSTFQGEQPQTTIREKHLERERSHLGNKSVAQLTFELFPLNQPASSDGNSEQAETIDLSLKL